MSSSTLENLAVGADSSKRKATDTAELRGKKTKLALKSPYDLYFEKKKVFQSNHKDILGSMLVKGIASNDDDDSDYDSEDSEGEQDTSKYTEEQMNGLRYINITKNREEQLKKMHRLVLGDQADSGFMMFNTSFSYDVLDSWEYTMKNRLSKMKPAQRLDALFAYTYTLKKFDCWMHDNEGGMGKLVKGLAGAWKRLLTKNSDKDLGWDIEYTKPGIMELLKQFKQEVEDVDSCYDMGKFKYM